MWYLYLLGGYYLIGVATFGVYMYRDPEYRDIIKKEEAIELVTTFFDETRLT